MNKLTEAIDEATGANDHSMSRHRPYDGQPWTDSGKRGATKVEGLTMRDIRDCYIRAIFQASGGPLYEEAQKGEKACLCENDVFSAAVDWNSIDPIALAQNMSCEIEKMMGIFPNVDKTADPWEDIPTIKLHE